MINFHFYYKNVTKVLLEIVNETHENFYKF